MTIFGLFFLDGQTRSEPVFTLIIIVSGSNNERSQPVSAGAFTGKVANKLALTALISLSIKSFDAM